MIIWRQWQPFRVEKSTLILAIHNFLNLLFWSVWLLNWGKRFIIFIDLPKVSNHSDRLSIFNWIFHKFHDQWKFSCQCVKLVGVEIYRYPAVLPMWYDFTIDFHRKKLQSTPLFVVNMLVNFTVTQWIFSIFQLLQFNLISNNIYLALLTLEPDLFI